MGKKMKMTLNMAWLLPPLSAKKTRKWGYKLQQPKMQHLDGQVRTYTQYIYETLNPSCLALTFQAAVGVKMLGINFLAHFEAVGMSWVSFKLENLTWGPEGCCFACSSYHNFEQVNAPCHKAQIISNWFYMIISNFDPEASTVTRCKFNTICML